MTSLPVSRPWRRRVLPLSVSAWHGLIAQGLAPDRSELIRGEIVEKMPKSVLHTRLVNRLIKLLTVLVTAECWVRKEDPLTLADSEPEPDVSVISGNEDDYAQHPTTALLVIEVSVSTLGEDREMAALYAEAGVSEFWIVNAVEQCIEVHRQPMSGAYQQQSRVALGQRLLCDSVPGVEVDVSHLFAGLPEASLP